MNKISKVGLIIYLLNLIIMVTLMLLSQRMPNFFKYIFWGALTITFAGAIGNKEENQLL